MTAPTAIPGLIAPVIATCDEPDDRALRALRLLTLRGNQPANPGVDRAIVRAAARTLRGTDDTYTAASTTDTKDSA